MIVDIVVPSLGESIAEVEIGEWQKAVGDQVALDEIVVGIESEKAAMEIPSPAAGVLVEVLKTQGEPSKVGEVVGRIDTEKVGSTEKADAPPPEAISLSASSAVEDRIMPSARRILTEKGLENTAAVPTGPGGRVLKEDALLAVVAQNPISVPPVPKPAAATGTRDEERVRMSLLRRTIANRLLAAKQSTAMLTTFNEIDMSNVMTLRKEQGESFVQTHQIKLGFMSFFIKAVVAALRDFPSLNARLEGDDLVFAKYYDIGVAVGGGKGLVVPVIRNADGLGFAEIERIISDYGKRAKENTLTLDELTGGTFSISNGGVFGSLMSTPILNPPQSGILGLHAIKERPIAVSGEVVIRPMMYIALSYDHRVVDGREAVTFLLNVKERIESPARILLEI